MLAVFLFLPIVVIGATAISMATRRANEEARRLRAELTALGELRPALVAVRTDADRAREALTQLRRR